MDRLTDSAAANGIGGGAALGRDYSVTDGAEGEREGGGQWDPSSSSLPPSTSSKTIVIRFISLIRFSLSAEGGRITLQRPLCVWLHILGRDQSPCSPPNSECPLLENQRIVRSSRFANILVQIRIVLNDSCHGPPSESVGCTCMPSFLPSS